jgi:hypothetical protein
MADETRTRRNRSYAGSPAGYGGGGFGEHGYGGGQRGEAERHVSGPVRGERDRPESIGGSGYAGDRTDGPHRGRGPRGYKRSDGEITLDGTVGSRWEKRHAEDIAEAVSGVAHVQNNLRVRENTAFGKETMTPERQPDGGRGSPLTGRSRPR